MKISKVIITSIAAASLLACKEEKKDTDKAAITSNDTVNKKDSLDNKINTDSIEPIIDDQPCPSCGMG